MKLYRILIFIFFLFTTSFLHAQDWINSSIINGTDVVDVVEIVIDENNHSYVLAKFKGDISFNSVNYSSKNASRFDIALVCYDDQKNELWLKHIGSDDHDAPKGMILNSDGDIVIIGDYRNTFKFTDVDSLVST
jgi:hypothetical protein